MLAIFKRDFKALFTNVIGWLFISVLLVFYGVYFFLYNLYGGASNIAYALSGCLLVLVIAIPILCMRTFTDERKNKTDQLIFTAPVSIFKIVLGKFLAVAATFTIPIIIMAISPLVLACFGDVSLAQNYMALLGYYLCGLACIAICVFVSTLTKSQIIAVIVSFVALFVGFMIDSFKSLVFSGDGFFSRLFNCLNLSDPLQTFMNGIFDWTKMLYYIIVIALFLVLAYFVIQKRRWTMTKMVWGRGLSRGLAFVLVIVISIAANMLLTLVPSTAAEIDVSSNKMYSLSDEAKDFFKNYKEDATIYVLASENDCDNVLNKTLKQIKSDNIKIEYVDVSQNPYFASKYTDQQLSASSLIVVGKNGSKAIDIADIYQYGYDSSYNYSPQGYDAEGLIASALQSVLENKTVMVCEVKGHNEIALGDTFKSLLAKGNFKTAELNLMTEDIPADCKILIINGPSVDLSKSDVDKITAFINNGGNVIASINSVNGQEPITINDLPNYKSLLASLNVNVKPGLVFEDDSNYSIKVNYALLPNVLESDITEGITGKKSVLAYESAAMTVDESSDAQATALLETSDNAYIKSEISNQMSVARNSSDESGKFNLGYEIIKSNGAGIIVYGSPYMFDDELDTYVYNHNSKMFTNALSALASENNDTKQVVLPAKSMNEVPVTVNGTVLILYGVLWGIVIPIGFLVAGIVIWAVRRKQ